jgi:catechol 2,3-dioxygenase-like lactoylglutathione lyase family enzyme
LHSTYLQSKELSLQSQWRSRILFLINFKEDREITSMLQEKILRVARPTDRLDQVIHFYTEGLGLQTLYRFEDHDGFDGVMVGMPGEAHHFEFTHHRGHAVGRAPTEDNLIVFYLPERSEWQQTIERMNAAGYQSVKSYNPYWDNQGVTFEDPDGYRVVLQNDTWRS